MVRWKYLVISLSICWLIAAPYLQNDSPIVTVVATGETDVKGNILATKQEDDPSGVGDVFVFKRSSFDATGIFCRYDAGRGDYQWAPEYTLLERNRLWVQWITFELEYKPIHLQVRLVKQWEDANETLHRETIWSEDKAALLVKGYLYFNLPNSKTENYVEVQRFNVTDEEEIIWDSMMFVLRHRTLASIIPVTYMPTDVFFSNLFAIVVTISSAGSGGFWRGRKILEKSTYPPDRHAWLPYVTPVAFVVVVFMSEVILDVMMQSPIAFFLVYAVMFYIIFLGFDYITTRIFRKKPPLIAIQQIIVDSEEEYFALPTYPLYIYPFIDSEGNMQEGFIPAGKLEDGDEFKERMRGNHRIIKPIVYRKEVEEITLKEKKENSEESTIFQEYMYEAPQWGLIAEDPRGTYKEIRIALEVKEPYRFEREERRPILEKKTTLTGEEVMVPKRDDNGDIMYKFEKKVYEERDLHVIAAPMFFQSTYEALRDVEKYAELAEELHRQRDAYRDLERQMQELIDKAVTEEVKLITDWGTLKALDKDMEKQLTDFQNQILELLKTAQTKTLTE